MPKTRNLPKLKLLPYREYAGVDRNDPLRFYFWPVIGAMYRRRIELCLAECKGGQCILEVGFGSGVTFPNLAEIYEEIYGLDLMPLSMMLRLYFEQGKSRRICRMAASYLCHMRMTSLTRSF